MITPDASVGTFARPKNDQKKDPMKRFYSISTKNGSNVLPDHFFLRVTTKLTKSRQINPRLRHEYLIIFVDRRRRNKNKQGFDKNVRV